MITSCSWGIGTVLCILTLCLASLRKYVIYICSIIDFTCKKPSAPASCHFLPFTCCAPRGSSSPSRATWCWRVGGSCSLSPARRETFQNVISAKGGLCRKTSVPSVYRIKEVVAPVSWNLKISSGWILHSWMSEVVVSSPTDPSVKWLSCRRTILRLGEGPSGPEVRFG